MTLQRITYNGTQRNPCAEADIAAAEELFNKAYAGIPASPPPSAEELAELERERQLIQESLRNMPLERVYWHVVRGMIYILDEDPEILVEDFVGSGGLGELKLTDDEWQAAMHAAQDAGYGGVLGMSPDRPEDRALLGGLWLCAVDCHLWDACSPRECLRVAVRNTCYRLFEHFNGVELPDHC